MGVQDARLHGHSRSIVPSVPGPGTSRELLLRGTGTVHTRRRGFLLLFSAPDVCPRGLLLASDGASYGSLVWTRSLDWWPGLPLLWSP